MREEETGTRYLSPLVKQDLAKLDSDGESRRLALKSLKQFIEQLDATSMPKFLSQIAESRESGGSRAYAISLYEEVARVHRKLIKPHLPRVMSSVIRALAASGSSPQLQQACAKVTAAMARYTIDSTMSIEDAEEIIRAVCDPLAEALTGKLEPVAAGAAACIHALIETENWKYASEETVQAVCQRITVALSEKSTRTVFHLQLASALSSMNPDTLGLYGATLVRTAEEILKTAVDSWQHRKAAAKLLQGVLIILSREALETEVDLAIHALESCRLDKMPHVRVAVSEALYAAKMLASGDSTQSCAVLSPLSKSISKSMDQSSSAWTKGDVQQSRTSWTKGDIEHSQSPWTKEDLLRSPVQKRIVSPNSQESNQLSFSPASTSTTESMHIRHPARRSNSRKSKRTPLNPAGGMGFAPSSRCSSLSTLSPSGFISDDCEFTPQKLDAKENMPVRITNANRALSSEEAGQFQVQAKSTLRMPVPFTDTLPSMLLDKFSDDIHNPESKDRNFAEELVDQSVPLAGKEVPDCIISRHMMSPMVSAILDELTETASNILAEDDAGLALLDSQIEEARNLKPNFRNGVLPRLRLGIKFNSPDPPVRSGNAADSSNQSFSRPIMQQNDKRPDVRNVNECVEGCVEVEIRDMNLAATDTMEDSSVGREEGSDQKLLRGSGPHEPLNNLKHHYVALTHPDVSPEKFAAVNDSVRSAQDIPERRFRGHIKEKSQSLITTKDFQPFATPKRLMRALQSLNSCNPDSKRVSLSEDVALCQHDAAVLSVVDMDVEASSEAGWSVRDNPIASDESFQADTSDEELEDRPKLPSEGAQLQIFLPSDSRDIHMLSPPEEARPHQQNASESNFIPRQPHKCMKYDIICSTISSDVHRSTSSEGPSHSSVVEDEDGAHIFSGLAKDEIKKSGLRCDCLAMSEGFINTRESLDKDCYRRQKSSERNPQTWWDSRFMLVRLLSRNWKHLCWYGEIILGGTLCVVLTLPLAMALAKALNSTPEHLVPT